MRNNLKNEIKNVDVILLANVVLLVIFGLFAVASASYPVALSKYNNGFHFLIRQIFWFMVGVVAFIFILIIPKKVITQNIKWLFPISVLLIILLFVPGFGKSVNGQVRWIKITESFSFQPSDLLKVAAIVYFSDFLSKHMKDLHSKDTFIKILIILGASVGPIMIKDFSTAIVIGFALFTIYVSAGMNKKEFLILLGIGSIFILYVLRDPDNVFRLRRIFGFLDNNADPRSQDLYQITQSLYAIALGGYLGVGYFHSRQKYTNIPEAYTDFIFAVICEEFGFIGSLILVLLFVMFIFRGYLIAFRSKNLFNKFLAIGLTSFIGIQSFFNMGVSAKLLPVTGITLPFISYGGTALVMAMVSAALLIRISKE